MSKNTITKEMMDKLYDAFLSLNSREECQEFLEDLCTFKEISQMDQRLKAAELLKDGNTYIQVMDAVNISSTTLSRVSRSLQLGNGYNAVLKKGEEK